VTRAIAAASLDGPLATLAVLALALAIDRWLGEPPPRAHPVVWIGAATERLLRAAPRDGAVAQLLYGGAIAVGVPLLAAGAAWLLVAIGSSLRATVFLRDGPSLAIAALGLAEIAARAWVLKTLFAVAALGDAARVVRDALAAGNLAAARSGLASLCSRDPGALDESELAAATIESVAENTSDSIVAPLLCFLAFGLPGAAFYRATNTIDAMIGYRGRFEYLGKAAARLDDLANLIPARVTALLLLAGGALAGADVRRGWRVLRRDAGRTASPNAARPMAAMAGLLRVALEKAGHYRLGDPLEPLGPEKIDAAWRVVRHALAIGLAGTATLLAGLHVAG
jgi:adenosylcobinamide-phosphate synthase